MQVCRALAALVNEHGGGMLRAFMVPGEHDTSACGGVPVLCKAAVEALATHQGQQPVRGEHAPAQVGEWSCVASAQQRVFPRHGELRTDTLGPGVCDSGHRCWYWCRWCWVRAPRYPRRMGMPSRPCYGYHRVWV